LFHTLDTANAEFDRFYRAHRLRRWLAPSRLDSHGKRKLGFGRRCLRSHGVLENPVGCVSPSMARLRRDQPAAPACWRAGRTLSKLES